MIPGKDGRIGQTLKTFIKQDREKKGLGRGNRGGTSSKLKEIGLE